MLLCLIPLPMPVIIEEKGCPPWRGYTFITGPHRQARQAVCAHNSVSIQNDVIPFFFTIIDTYLVNLTSLSAYFHKLKRAFTLYWTHLGEEGLVRQHVMLLLYTELLEKTQKLGNQSRVLQLNRTLFKSLHTSCGVTLTLTQSYHLDGNDLPQSLAEMLTWQSILYNLRGSRSSSTLAETKTAAIHSVFCLMESLCNSSASI